MNRSVSRIRCNSLKPLKSVLKRWIRLNEEIAKNWQKKRDLPWWYNERALLSVFAGAIWLEGGVAFEEYSSSKHPERAKRATKSVGYSGRVDLRFEIERREFIAEAKYCISNQRRHIEMNLEKACHDARKSVSNGARRLGILFVQIYQSTKGEDEITGRWIKNIQAVETDATAWFLSPIGRKTMTEFYEQNGKRCRYYCPGAAILIRNV